MAKRTITDDEIALIKAMQKRGMANKDIQFFFNRPGRAVNSGRITDIGKGTYSDCAAIQIASDQELDGFLSTFSAGGVSAQIQVPAGSSIDTPEIGPVDPRAINRLFVKGSDGAWRLAHGEADDLECKANFGFKHSHNWIRAIAALANNRGGYVLFGVADKGTVGPAGEDLSHAVVGMGSKDFENADPADVTNKLRSCLDPTPRIQIRTHSLAGVTIGVIHVEQHPSRPVIVTRTDGDKVKEGDIFFRYPGQSIRIKYSDLRAILDGRDAMARREIMPAVERLLTLGPRRALIADLDEGTLGNGGNLITIDPELVKQIQFVREGDFTQADGAPTLRLVGDVVAATSTGKIESRGVVTDRILLRNFLARETIANPTEYVRFATEGAHAAWLPIFYFATVAKLDRAGLEGFVTKLDGAKARKDRLLKRIKGDVSAYERYAGTPGTILKRILAGDDVTPTDAKGAINAAMAVSGLKDGQGLAVDQLLGLLSNCLALIEATPTASGLSHVRRAACRLDELLYPL
jgi:hypothetical protein